VQGSVKTVTAEIALSGESIRFCLLTWRWWTSRGPF